MSQTSPKKQLNDAQQVLNHIPLPNESNLYYLAKNYIQQKHGSYSLPEAQILVFCIPIKISELLLNKFLTENLTEFSPRIHMRIGLLLKTLFETKKSDKLC